jgi:CheY-like chemotaxis protein
LTIRAARASPPACNLAPDKGARELGALASRLHYRAAGDAANMDADSIDRVRPPRARVLVIEDEAPVRELLCELVAMLGHEVEGAPDGRRGLARLATFHYDVVLTDLAMPGASGWDVVRELRARRAPVSVIMLSAHATEQDVRRAQMEKVPLLRRPFRIEVLRGLIRQTLGLLPPTLAADPA